jgi:hypothetical protein
LLPGNHRDRYLTQLHRMPYFIIYLLIEFN